MWQTIPELGTGLLIASLVGSGYAFCLGTLSTVHPRLLPAAKRSALGTTALCAAAVVVLAYAFVTHDFRMGYVVRYSDRSMPIGYLVSALWGGQDGSLLFWMFLLAVYSCACIVWLRDRFRALQPFIVATLMGVLAFFGLTTLVAANPFATSLAGAPVDGLGLNPLLQNAYMVVHPPALYLGFVGCTFPYAFVMAALISGQLDNKAWIDAIHKWMLLAWLFLTLGNALGMIWAYVELGWGGYWAWDPVENASFLPWLTATACVHSTLIQQRTEQRKAQFRLWNIVLVCLTFFLTLFGTFLTRSGIIASVHAFAKSNLGTYFLVFLAILIVLTSALVVLRWPKLRSDDAIEPSFSLRTAFSASNWAFTAATAFVLVATILPILSNAIVGRTITVGPEFFNRWITPFGLLILALMALAPLLGWKKTDRSTRKRSLLFPSASALFVAVLFAFLGNTQRFVPFPLDSMVTNEPAQATQILGYLGSIVPLLTVSLVTFAVAAILQLAWNSLRTHHTRSKDSFPRVAFVLIAQSRKKIGAYVAHLGFAAMIMGFLGQTWGVSDQASLSPGQSFTIENYTLHYDSFRVESDAAREMYFADLAVTDARGETLGRVSPAKFVYRTHKNQPTSEVDVLRSVRDDLYVVLGNLSPQSGKANLQVFINPLVSFIWAGIATVVFGACMSLWPSSWRSQQHASSNASWSSIAMALRAFHLSKAVREASVVLLVAAALAAIVGASIAGGLSLGLLALGAVLLLLGGWEVWASLQIVALEYPVLANPAIGPALGPALDRAKLREHAETLVREQLAVDTSSVAAPPDNCSNPHTQSALGFLSSPSSDIAQDPDATLCKRCGNNNVPCDSSDVAPGTEGTP